MEKEEKCKSKNPQWELLSSQWEIPIINIMELHELRASWKVKPHHRHHNSKVTSSPFTVSVTIGRHTSLQDGFEPDPLESFVIENTRSITTEVLILPLLLLSDCRQSFYLLTKVIRSAFITYYSFKIMNIQETGIADILIQFWIHLSSNITKPGSVAL